MPPIFLLGVLAGCGGGGGPHTTTFARYAFDANRYGADLIHPKVWGTFGSTSSHPNSIVDIDIETGVTGTPIAVGADPGAIGVSADGKVAYVGLNSPDIQVVNLETRTLGPLISYSTADPNTAPIEIAVNPSNSNEFVIGVKSLQNGAQRGPYFFRNNAFVAAPATDTTAFQAIAWINGTQFVRMRQGGSGTLTKYSMTGSTMNILLDVIENHTFQGGFHLAQKSRIVSDDGSVYSTTDLSLLGSLDSLGEAFLSGDTEPSRNLSWAATGGTSNPLVIRTFQLSNNTSINLYQLAMNNEPYLGMMRVGRNGLVVRSNNAIYCMPIAPGL